MSVIHGEFGGRKIFSRHSVYGRTIRPREETSGKREGKRERERRMEKEALWFGRYGKEERVPHERNENEATTLYPLPFFSRSLSLSLFPLSASSSSSLFPLPTVATPLSLSNARTLQQDRNIDQDSDTRVERRQTSRKTCGTFSSQTSCSPWFLYHGF